MATFQVGASTDDCFRRLTTASFSLTGGTLAVGAFSATIYQQGAGMRFLNVTIPQGSTIDVAYLTLRCGFASSGTAVNSRISAEDVDDAPTFADDGAAFDTRWAARTTARVDWDAIPAWTLNVDYDSPSIITVIQEIVDRESWVSGQDIVIFWEDFEDRSTHADEARRVAHSWNGSAEFAPKLVITYTTGWSGGDIGVVPIADIAKINGVALADILKVNGVA